MVIKRSTTYYVAWLLSVVLMLGACHPKDADTPQPDSVPANLLATTTYDSVITLTAKIDFSTVSATGQGPKGSLIRWDTSVPTGHFKAFTYDQQSRLVNTLEIQNDLRLAEIVQYQGDYLAESYTSDYFYDNQTSIRVNLYRKYKYNTDKQLKQIWLYVQTGNTNTFRLNVGMEYDYDSNGQLKLLRSRSFFNGYNSYRLLYWEKGDCVRDELYVAPTKAEPVPGIVQFTYSYDNQSDPRAKLPLLDPYPPNAHFVTRTTIYSGGSSFEKIYETATDYQYEFTEGRLTNMRARSLPGDSWSDWGINKFTYAP